MAVNRIEFSINGSTPDYQLPFNPVEVHIPQAIKSEIMNSVETIDSESIVFEKSFDSRRGRLVWDTHRADPTSNFFTMVAYLENNYLSQDPLYMRLNDIGDALNVFTTWTQIKVISIDKKIRRGGALVYEYVHFMYELAE